MPSKEELKQSNKTLLDQNARLTTRVSLLELAMEAMGHDPLAIRDEATLEKWASQQQAKKASKVHPACMIEGGGQGGARAD